MNLSRERISEINALLANPEVSLPPFRREVSPTGGNYQWLKKHIQTNNKKLPERLLELLGIELPVTQ